MLSRIRSRDSDSKHVASLGRKTTTTTGFLKRKAIAVLRTRDCYSKREAKIRCRVLTRKCYYEKQSVERAFDQMG